MDMLEGRVAVMVNDDVMVGKKWRRRKCSIRLFVLNWCIYARSCVVLAGLIVVFFQLWSVTAESIARDLREGILARDSITRVKNR